MIQIEKRAFYNLLRLNWEIDPTLAVKPWQVENYRTVPVNDLLERLKKFSISLTRIRFINFADNCESPEEMTDLILADEQISPEKMDQAYLIIFELWRRLLGDKYSLSILGDELDYQIAQYDEEESENLDPIYAVLHNLLGVLHKNIDSGLDPQEALRLVSSYSANDLETFLYDFISTELDKSNEIDIKALFDEFLPCMEHSKWFALLRLRVTSRMTKTITDEYVSEIMHNFVEEKDLDFNLELLTHLLMFAPYPLFFRIALLTAPLLEGKSEDELADLLFICLDYFEISALHKEVHEVQKIIDNRAWQSAATLRSTDPDILRLMNLLARF